MFKGLLAFIDKPEMFPADPDRVIMVQSLAADLFTVDEGVIGAVHILDKIFVSILFVFPGDHFNDAMFAADFRVFDTNIIFHTSAQAQYGFINPKFGF